MTEPPIRTGIFSPDLTPTLTAYSFSFVACSGIWSGTRDHFTVFPCRSCSVIHGNSSFIAFRGRASTPGAECE